MFHQNRKRRRHRTVAKGLAKPRAFWQSFTYGFQTTFAGSLERRRARLMRTLHGYLTRQVLATLVMTVAVFTFILLLGNVLREILTLLVNRQATLVIVAQSIALLVPFVLVFALPMGMLTATLLVFGRFSADQELTAVRANGVSLLALATPVLLLSVALSLLCGWVNMQVGPQCRVAYKQLLLDFGTRRPSAMLTEGRFVSDFPGYLIFVGRVRGNELEDVLLSKLESDQVLRRVRAPGGRVTSIDTNQQMTLLLTNVWGVEYRAEAKEWQPFVSEEWSLTIDFKPTGDSRAKINYSDMTFRQLLEEKRGLEKLLVQSRVVGKASAEVLRQEIQRNQQMKDDLLMPITVQMHQQVAFSFACIGFTLVGIPLGIRAHRRETSAGVGISILLVLVYYSFIILAQSQQTRADLAPHLMVWLPNFIFQTAGAVLLWRANRGV